VARTDKWEHRTDSWHRNHRDERKARPSGRDRDLFTADLALDNACEAYDTWATTAQPTEWAAWLNTLTENVNVQVHHP
jgi:hypothetical protein